MGFFFSSLFWGIILVVLGITVILKAVLKIDIPVIKILFAIILIYWGLKLLIGYETRKSESTIIFNKASIKTSPSGGEYNVIFGNGEIDFRDLDLKDNKVSVEVNVIFSSGDLILDVDLPVKIKASTVFGEIKLPKGNAGFLGDSVYYSDNFQENEHYLYLEITTVFGNARIITQ